jgi:molybdopterin converting factor small subunit
MHATHSDIFCLTLEIKLFGAFRAFAAMPVTVQVPAGATVAMVKSALGEVLVSHYGAPEERVTALLAASPLATADAVLTEHDVVLATQSLAVLPPVCGG